MGGREDQEGKESVTEREFRRYRKEERGEKEKRREGGKGEAREGARTGKEDRFKRMGVRGKA